jgi:plasmid maintenance system antidote protein VapI
MATKSRLWTDTPTHPGEVIADELAARELTPARLAKEAGLDLEELESVMRGESRVEAVMAWALEGRVRGAFGTVLDGSSVGL